MARTKKQTELPGIEKPTIPELDTLLETYAEKAAALSEARQAVGDLKRQIIALAKEKGLTTYRDETASPPLVLTLKERDVAVKIIKLTGEVDLDEDELDEEAA